MEIQKAFFAPTNQEKLLLYKEAFEYYDNVSVVDSGICQILMRLLQHYKFLDIDKIRKMPNLSEYISFAFPELEAHKPKERHGGGYWWRLDDINSRLFVLREIITKLKNDSKGCSN